MTRTGAVDLVATRDDLWKLAEGCPADALGWMAIGWRLGLLDGHESGSRAAEQEMADAWHRVYLDVQAMARRPALSELTRRRGGAA